MLIVILFMIPSCAFLVAIWCDMSVIIFLAVPLFFFVSMMHIENLYVLRIVFLGLTILQYTFYYLLLARGIRRDALSRAIGIVVLIHMLGCLFVIRRFSFIP